MKILYVEDNADFRCKVTQTYLGGHDVWQAPDGREGIEIFDQGGFELVLLDYQMDEVHGPDVIRHIREIDQQVPVIALSMDDSLNRELMCLGATRALAKRHVGRLPELIESLVA